MAHNKSLEMRAIQPREMLAYQPEENVWRRYARKVAKEQRISVRRAKRILLKE